jgi:hypothetical protein
MSYVRSLRPVYQMVLLTAVLLTLLALVLLSAHHHVDILQAVQKNKGDVPKATDEGQGLTDFTDAISAVQQPVNVTVGAIGGLGVAAGAALIAVGSPKGLKTAGGSAAAIAVLFLGNGIIK